MLLKKINKKHKMIMKVTKKEHQKTIVKGITENGKMEQETAIINKWRKKIE